MAESTPSADVAALQAFMTWARAEGYWFDCVTVGSVQVVGARDYCPSVETQVRRAAADEQAARDEGEDESIYDTVGRGLPGYQAIRARGQ
jgi:hypothetical protein